VVLGGALSEARAEALRAEALRIYGRYQREFVEALGLCPWAVRAREEGHVAVRVVLDDPAAEAALAATEALAADEEVQVGLLVLPRAAYDRSTHEAFVSELREQHAAGHGGSPPFAMAAFHPDAEPDLDHPARLVPFIRRSPDPTIQLVRLTSLEAVRRRAGDRGTAFMDLSTLDLAQLLSAPAQPPLHERVADKNRETIAAMGVAEAEAILATIARDRDAAYARVGEETP
tara:strand:+ start:210 stop:902 length:693 start_codon:yes stop_codon:yes gene_type:complete